MSTNDPQRTRLAQLVRDLAVVHGKVTLASGLESDFYVDMRRATLHHEAAPLIGHVMINMLEEAGYTCFCKIINKELCFFKSNSHCSKYYGKFFSTSKYFCLSCNLRSNAANLIS